MTVTPLTTGLPASGRWLVHARPDPITGLVAFPDFHAAFPGHLLEAVTGGAVVGVAIGDVDHLKAFVENSNTTDPESFGHLAGNALMAELGRVSARWFHRRAFPAGCVSTFGGDEVIIVAVTADAEAFRQAVVGLRDRCRQVLPRSVSFAVTVVSASTPGLAEALMDATRLGNTVLAAVDRLLFARKAARRRSEDNGFVAVLDLDLEVGVHVSA